MCLQDQAKLDPDCHYPSVEDGFLCGMTEAAIWSRPKLARLSLKGLRNMVEIREDDLTGEKTRALLALHLAGMHASSPPGGVFAFDLSGLLTPEVTVWTAWQGDLITGVGALKMLPDGNGEVKSMRTHPKFTRTGTGGLILETIIANAKARGARRLSLETGSGPAFEPALALYRRRGFTLGAPFSDYEQSDFNQFLHLAL